MTEQELINAVLEDKFKNVKKLAVEKFGEENVDIKLAHRIDANNISTVADYYIACSSGYNAVVPYLYLIIYFPKKTITCNETGRTHDIEEVYCRLSLLSNESFNIATARAKYTTAEIYSNYMHSHVNGISYPSDVWRNTCLGNSGSPLNILKNAPVRDDIDWINIFNEIDRFYEVESLKGIPYRRMDDVTEFDSNRETETAYNKAASKIYKLDEDFSDFAFFVLCKLKRTPKIFSNIDGEFMLNEPLYDFKIRLTNLIVEYLEIQKRVQSEKDYKVIEKNFNKILEKNVKTPTGRYTPLFTRGTSSQNGAKLFTFKGKDVIKKVIPTKNSSMYLMPKITFQIYIYMKIIIMINYERFRSNTTEGVKIVL